SEGGRARRADIRGVIGVVVGNGRLRRYPEIMRFRWLTALGLLAACAAATGCGHTYALTSEKAWSGSPLRPQPHVDRAVRRQINRTLDLFVRYGVERVDPARAYAVASPMMRSSQTRAQWNAGTLPVPPYQTKGH